jgi:hypothetical protein
MSTAAVGEPTITTEPAAAPEPPAAAKKSEPRPYVVLRQVSSPSSPGDLRQTWEFLRNVDANSAEQAVRKAAEILVATQDAGEPLTVTLVAVSASRFVPVTVSVETKTQLKLS